jgi:malonyl-CoA O-methyltransferase
MRPFFRNPNDSRNCCGNSPSERAMSKHAVRRAFDRAAASYDSAATLQRRVCQLLLEQLAPQAPSRILDAGCGTGYAINLLANRWPDSNIVAADFAPAMVATAGGGVCTDIEVLPFAAAAFDLYWSSLSIQWCDTHRAIAEAARVLAPGGHLAVSSLAPGTLAELDAAFAGTDKNRHVLIFHPTEVIASACQNSELANVKLEQHTVCLHHPNLTSLLRELKALGANQVVAGRRPGLMGRRAWQAMEQRYEIRREASGLPATFKVILCTAVKPIS